MTQSNERQIKLRNYIAYGAGDLYGGGAFFIVTTFSMFYLVNVVGMNPVLAGLIPALGKVWDAISDPLMGYISDNTKENRFGKRRVWFLVSIIPIALSFMFIWFPTNISSQMGKFFFYFFAYIFFFTVSTMSYIPYAALSAEMTFDRKERNNLNGTRIMFSFISTLLGGLIVKPIVDFYDGSQMGYFVMSIIFGLIFALPWITLYFGTWELPQPERKKDNTHFLKNFFSLFKSKTCRIHVGMYVCSYGTMDIFMSLIMFFIIDYLHLGSFFVIAQGSFLLAMMAMLPLYVKIATEKGHSVSYIMGLSLFTLGMICMAFQPQNPPLVPFVLNMILLGSGLAAGSLIPHQLLPFVVDVDKLMSAKDRAGTYSAVMTLTRKLFLGIVILQGVGFMLSSIGYKNTVPTVLSAPQYEQAFDLIEENPKDKDYKQGEYTAFLEKSYSLEEDGNYHLNHYQQKVEKLVYFEWTKDESISQLDFEERVLPYFDTSLPTEMRQYIYMRDSFILEDGFYRYKPENLKKRELSNDDLYKLRILLDDIKYLYTGIGEQRKLVQKESTVSSLHTYFILFPLIMCIIGIIVATRFKLSPENHSIVVAELERLDKGGLKEDVDPKTKEVCELLTGLPYDSLYGGNTKDLN